MKKLLTSAVLATMTGSVFAAPVTIDTDSYAIGTNISQVDSNAWIQAVNWSGTAGFSYSDIYVGDAPTMDIYGEQPWDSVAGGFGDHAFARQTANEGLVNWWHNAHHYEGARQDLYDYPASFYLNVVGVRFFEPVQYLELRSLTGPDMSYVWAYDMAGNLIDSLRQTIPTSTTIGGRHFQNLEITRNQADIAYVIYGGGGTSARLNQITYDVPAPAPIALLCMGLTFAGLMRPRKRLSRTQSL